MEPADKAERSQWAGQALEARGMAGMAGTQDAVSNSGLTFNSLLSAAEPSGPLGLHSVSCIRPSLPLLPTRLSVPRQPRRGSHQAPLAVASAGPPAARSAHCPLPILVCAADRAFRPASVNGDNGGLSALLSADRQRLKSRRRRTAADLQYLVASRSRSRVYHAALACSVVVHGISRRMAFSEVPALAWPGPAAATGADMCLSPSGDGGRVAAVRQRMALFGGARAGSRSA